MIVLGLKPLLDFSLRLGLAWQRRFLSNYWPLNFLLGTLGIGLLGKAWLLWIIGPNQRKRGLEVNWNGLKGFGPSGLKIGVKTISGLFPSGIYF